VIPLIALLILTAVFSLHTEGLWKCKVQWTVRKEMDFGYSIAKEGDGLGDEVIRDAEGGGGGRGHSEDKTVDRLDSKTT